jgi:hypothetical protein
MSAVLAPARRASVMRHSWISVSKVQKNRIVVSMI